MRNKTTRCPSNEFTETTSSVLKLYAIVVANVMISYFEFVMSLFVFRFFHQSMSYFSFLCLNQFVSSSVKEYVFLCC